MCYFVLPFLHSFYLYIQPFNQSVSQSASQYFRLMIDLVIDFVRLCIYLCILFIFPVILTYTRFPIAFDSEKPSVTDSNVCLLVGCLTSQQHAGVSQGRICTDNFTCCHTEIEVANQVFYLAKSQYTDTGPTVPALTQKRQAPGRVATALPILKSLV